MYDTPMAFAFMRDLPLLSWPHNMMLWQPHVNSITSSLTTNLSKVLELSLCTTPSSHLNGRAIIIHASLLIPTTYSSVPCVWYRSYKYNMISIASRKSPGVVYSSTTVREYLYFSRQKTELLVTVNPVEKKYYILYTQSIDYCKI